MSYPSVLTIAGSDSSGGAGTQADIKVMSATGSYAASVITALTAQNTQGVQAVYDISADFVARQIESVFADLTICAVKIGMLHSQEIITVVADALAKYQPKHVVLDPVMVAKSGHALLKEDTVFFLRDCLLPHVTLVTPNTVEIERWIDKKITNAAEQEDAAKKIGDQFKLNVLVKGGHLDGAQASDVVYLYAEEKFHWFHAERIATRNTHGTGCSLSSAIASYLAQDYALCDAIRYAKEYLTQAIASGKELTIGRGCGPVDHFYRYRK